MLWSTMDHVGADKGSIWILHGVMLGCTRGHKMAEKRSFTVKNESYMGGHGIITQSTSRTCITSKLASCLSFQRVELVAELNKLVRPLPDRKRRREVTCSII